ncbi:hypothetical protein EV363DRAFT_1158066 [Boletus edulis]|nr:hypothetical protein EV363DRAFT_1158066 [Boletus edulis]
MYSNSIADAQNQLLNEDGDPIIDISEPVNEYSQTNIAPSSVPGQDSIPFSLLPPDERERRRRERDRILDLLEEEERLQQLQEERDAEEEHKEAIRKRKESAKAELERLKGARELQKKIGKALVRHAEEAGKDKQGEDVRSKPQDTYPVAKKSVSFADAPAMKADGEDEQTPMRRIDWGDVTPGRLRAQTRIPLVSTAEAEKYPMKMRVVERHPTTTATSPSHSAADSDDESPSTLAGNNSSDEDKSSSTNNDLSGDEPLEDGFDYDAAQHHREIALEYHKKRRTIGAETAKAMAAHSLDDCDQHETLSGQLPLSHFRADRMAAAYDKSHSHVSTSIGHTVIPASRQKSTRNSVRLGKLEDDQLVGGDSGESGSEDEAIREVMHMLQAGNIQNAGPNFEPSTVVTAQNPDATARAIQTSSATDGAKRSRFKLARGGGIADRGTFENDDTRDNTQLQPAISSVVERKAPRSSPSQRFPINRPLL